jgi:glycosyltransferase involved in cell wall biosynthesis
MEVNGGAEYHCRIVAERLNHLYDVEVLSSCATSYQDWANIYPEGVSDVNGVKVTRFASATPRDKTGFKAVSRHIRKRKPYQKILRLLGLLDFYEKFAPHVVTEYDNYNWAKTQGPNIPGLIEHLQQQHHKYDVLIFFTYLYYPTVIGLQVAPHKSILIPTAHDEPPIYLPFFAELFNAPKAILYNTISEKRFVNNLFKNDNIYNDVVAVGVEPTSAVNLPPIQPVLSADSKYIIYIGRIEAGKGCKTLIKYFLKYKKNSRANIKLVLVGQPLMPIPKHPDIVVKGFVDEDIKIALLKNALALVIPSLYESLSMVTIESMAYGIPVIANEHCEVLKDHINNSNAGFLYLDFDGFKNAIDGLLTGQANLPQLSDNAQKYVAQNYSWEVVIDKYVKAIDFVSGVNSQK